MANLARFDRNEESGGVVKRNASIPSRKRDLNLSYVEAFRKKKMKDETRMKIVPVMEGGTRKIEMKNETTKEVVLQKPGVTGNLGEYENYSQSLRKENADWRGMMKSNVFTPDKVSISWAKLCFVCGTKNAVKAGNIVDFLQVKEYNDVKVSQLDA